jgi:nucleoside-diphosphate-sugar epimerase
MKVLVTGATGFLGQRLVLRLRRMGYQVNGTGRDLEIMGKLHRDHGVPMFPADIADAMQLEGLPSELDAIVHCAALSSPWGRYTDFVAANVTATRNILNFASRRTVARFVHISSPSIYVEPRPRLDVKEDDPLPESRLNHYIATKRVAESLVQQAAREHGLNTLILRPQGLVGRGDRAIFPRILKAAQRGSIPRIGEGQTLTDLTHVENAVEAIVCALSAPASYKGRSYNISNGQPVEIYGFIEALMKRLCLDFRWRPLSFSTAYRIGQAMEWWSERITGKEPLLTRYTACTLGLSRTLNIDRARRELGYSPKHTMEQAFDEVASSMEKA